MEKQLSLVPQLTLRLYSSPPSSTLYSQNILPCVKTLAGLCSLPAEVTQACIPKESKPLATLLLVDHYSCNCPFTFINGHKNTKKTSPLNSLGCKYTPPCHHCMPGILSIPFLSCWLLAWETQTDQMVTAASSLMESLLCPLMETLIPIKLELLI